MMESNERTALETRYLRKVGEYWVFGLDDY